MFISKEMSLKKFNNVSRISTLCTFINLWIYWFNGFDDFDFNINLFILIVQCWLRFEFLSTFVTLVSPYLMTFDMHLKSTLWFEFLLTFFACISWTFWNFLFPDESGINWNIFVLDAMIIEDSRNLPFNPILLSALQPSRKIFPHPSCSFCKFPMKMFLYESKDAMRSIFTFSSLFLLSLSSYLISWQMKAFYNSHGKK